MQFSFILRVVIGAMIIPLTFWIGAISAAFESRGTGDVETFCLKTGERRERK